MLIDSKPLLYIFNPITFEQIDVISDYESLIWHRSYFKAGLFSVTFKYAKDKMAYIEKGNIIYKKETKEAAFIESIKVEIKKSEIIATVSGRFISSITSRRVVTKCLKTNANVVKVAEELVANSCINTEVNRVIPNLRILPCSMQKSDTVDLQYMQLDIALQNLLVPKQLGYRMYFDYKQKKLEFEIYQGKDLSYGPGKNDVVIFSTEYNNILEQDYFNSDEIYKNVAYVVHQRSMENPKEIEIVDNTMAIGLERREIITEATPPTMDENNNPISLSDYNIYVKNAGNTLIRENYITTVSNTTIDQESVQYKYLIDYDLGDVITCENKLLNLRNNERIIEVVETYDKKGESRNKYNFDLELIFGNRTTMR